jgi:hypothetical protein
MARVFIEVYKAIVFTLLIQAVKMNKFCSFYEKGSLCFAGTEIRQIKEITGFLKNQNNLINLLRV